MRMFIAIPLPPDTRRALKKVQEHLQACAKGGRYVPYENFHITLHFIGESGDLYAAALACDEAVRGIRPFVLRLTGYDSFQKGDTKTAIVTLDGQLGELYRLHETLTAALGANGFSLPGGYKRFAPHITLARDVIHEGTIPQGFRWDALELNGGIAFTANQLNLFESKNVQGAMVYAPLHMAKLR